LACCLVFILLPVFIFSSFLSFSFFLFFFGLILPKKHISEASQIHVWQAPTHSERLVQEVPSEKNGGTIQVEQSLLVDDFDPQQPSSSIPNHSLFDQQGNHNLFRSAGCVASCAYGE
jgi:hypothetical protein